MNISYILLYCARAFSFAVVVGMVWSIGYIVMSIKNQSWKGWQHFFISLMFVCYLSALLQITVIRQWSGFLDVAQWIHTMETIQWVPLKTTIETAQQGMVSFIYHVGGNMIWFVPFGVLCPLWKKHFFDVRYFILISIALSLGIEILQWILSSGISDIDDILFNTMGSMMGWYLLRYMARKIKIDIIQIADK